MNNISAQLRNKIKTLYPDRDDYVCLQLDKIIKDFKEKNPAKAEDKGPLFTAKDVILICYPDHVQEDGFKAFQTMGKFLGEFAQGIVNKIHFLPFYPWSSDDGFSVKDYYAVDSAYGDWGDLANLKKDFGLVFDLVLNHASVKSQWFKKFLAGQSKFKDFFIAYDKPIDLSRVFRPRIHPLLTPIKAKSGQKYVWTTFSDDQADLNYANPEVLLEMIRVWLFYLTKGAEAVRLDAVAYCWKDLASNCFNLPQDHILVQIFREILKTISPKAWIISETVLPHKKNIGYFGDGHNEANLVYNFVLETLLIHTFLKQDVSLANQYLNSINKDDLSPTNSYLNLSVSHDGIHVIPAREALTNRQLLDIAHDLEGKGGQVLYRATEDGGQEPYEFNITYPSALAKTEEFLASQAIQLALKGVPLIYFNNLIGADNWTEGVAKLGYARAINRQKFDCQGLVKELKDPDSKKHKIYTGYCSLLKARINEPLFSPLAKQEFLDFNKQVLAILRSNQADKLLALTNVSSRQVKLEAKEIIKTIGKEKVQDLISKKSIDLTKQVVLAPYQVLWIK